MYIVHIVVKDNGRLDVSVQINFEGHHYVGLLDQNYEAVRRDSVNPRKRNRSLKLQFLK